MNLRVQFIVAIGLVCAVAAFAQPNATLDSPFQVRYAANLEVGDSLVNMTNTGASDANICVNVYTFSPDEQLVSCCGCVITPNGLKVLSVRNDLISNTLTPAVPGAVVIKLLASANASSCNPAAPGAAVPGLAAWGTTIHLGAAAPDGVPSLQIEGRWDMTETAFTPATLGDPERARITAFCGFIQANGSGYGICRSCREGALGSGKLM